MTDLQVFIFDTSLITFESFNRNPLFSLVQEFRSHWGIRHEDTNDDTPDTTKRADDDEFVTPRRQGTFDVTYGVTQEATQCDTGSVGSVPQTYSEGCPMQKSC